METGSEIGPVISAGPALMSCSDEHCYKELCHADMGTASMERNAARQAY